MVGWGVWEDSERPWSPGLDALSPEMGSLRWACLVLGAQGSLLPGVSPGKRLQSLSLWGSTSS